MIVLSHNVLSSSSPPTIILKPSKTWIRVWIIRCVLAVVFFVLFLQIEIFNPIYYSIVLGAIILGGFFESSKNSNLLLTPTHIEGGIFFRSKTVWSEITETYTCSEYLYWEEISKKGKILTRKSPFNHWGRECLQNGKQVSKDLVIDWISKLRKAESKSERVQLLRDFRKIATTRERLIRTLPEEEKENANRLFQEYKNIEGENRTERRIEIAQYFKQKGWILPKIEISKGRQIIGCLVVVFSFSFLFWIFVMFFKRAF